MCGERETYVREHKEDNGRKESSLLPFSFQFKSPAITQTCARHSPQRNTKAGLRRQEESYKYRNNGDEVEHNVYLTNSWADWEPDTGRVCAMCHSRSIAVPWHVEVVPRTFRGWMGNLISREAVSVWVGLREKLLNWDTQIKVVYAQAIFCSFQAFCRSGIWSFNEVCVSVSFSVFLLCDMFVFLGTVHLSV